MSVRVTSSQTDNQAKAVSAKSCEELRITCEQTSQFLDLVPGGLFRYKADGDCTLDFVNAWLVEMLGCETEEEFRAYTGNSFRGLVHPDDLERVEREINEQVSGTVSTDKVTYRVRRKDGEIRWLEDKGHLVVDEQGERWFYVVVLDITERMEFQNELQRSNERLRILADFNNDVMFDVNYRQHFAEIFGDFEKRFGRPFEADDFMRLSECIDLGDFEDVVEDLTLNMHVPSYRQGSHEDVDMPMAIPGAEGEPMWCRYQAVVLRDEDDAPYRCVGRLLDTHEMMMQQMSYRMRAERDSLTGIYNREAAIEKMKELQTSKLAPCSMIFIDVDDFKGINDTFGHPVGDKVLTHLADHLVNVVRGGDIVARFGGDEFAVFILGVGAGARLDQIIGLIRQNAFVDFEDEHIENPVEQLTLSIGIASSPVSNVPFEELYQCADDALYEVKRKGKNNFVVKELPESIVRAALEEQAVEEVA